MEKEEEVTNYIPAPIGVMKRDAPQLVALLKEMKEGLDSVRSKVQALAQKVKENQFPTGEGISYLEAKHLLLLSYCQSIVYYLLRKAKGLCIEGHPVVWSLVEIRLFLEKIRPIDKKLHYQIEKLTRSANDASTKLASNGNDNDASVDNKDLLKYRPNPDLLVDKLDQTSQGREGVYRPPMFAPTSMDEEKSSKQKRLESRKGKEALRQAKNSGFVKDLIDDLEGRPEEIREMVGHESKDLTRMRARFEERARVEEELFTRVPISKMERKKIKRLERSRNGLLGLTDDFYGDIAGLVATEESGRSRPSDHSNSMKEERKFKKRNGRSRPLDHTNSGKEERKFKKSKVNFRK
ncbi:neuroguidin [Amborella trichopoda]|uniref:Sas10 C-terminal domain-containing protein n=1 Tax=Amborella trichopoda TaxID=13333 RepID=U5CMI3_AMBTC|nr:neuroguidin [Amborella trichopoda]XP_020528153.1 neuroguidin [Amborella trichopoda]ERN14351.1 hypothetical protein AMTR_s00033p00216030 [Amborella trichopoda]|eukprot:XP_006852884.1 neuroguidin [Amborella trichopoda]